MVGKYRLREANRQANGSYFATASRATVGISVRYGLRGLFLVKASFDTLVGRTALAII